jgi:hypothetical protein
MKRADLLLALASGLLSLLAAEGLLTRFANSDSRPVVRFAGIEQDGREWLHALYDLRVAGVAAYPIVSAQVYGQFLTDRNDETALLPLAGLSRTTTTFCNELHDFIVFRSDRYGFRNDDRLWDEKPSVMLAGDSFAQGACVPDDATIPAGLARLGFPTTSVAYNSNGPLAELAALVEYGPLIRPATVIWLYYEGNDLTDLGRELEFPVLRKYFEPDFRQDLPRRQAEIDRRIKAALDARPEIQKLNQAVSRRWSLTGVVGLRNTRALVAEAARLAFERGKTPAARELDDAVVTRPTDNRLSDLELTLIRAREVVDGWGGTLLFAYLPATERYRFPDAPEVAELPKVEAEVTQIAANLRVPVIDLGPALAAERPALLFPKAEWPVHFTEEGYRLVAAAIAERLRAMPARR